MGYKKKDYSSLIITKQKTMLEEAKQDLKQRIIAENSEEFYYKLIAERTEKIANFKASADLILGRDNQQFVKEYMEETLKNNVNLAEEEQLYELVMTHIALDVFLS